MEGTEETHCGDRCELPQPLQNRHFASVDVYLDATDESVKTARNEGGVEAREGHHCCEVLQGREVDVFVQGHLEHP